MTDQLTLPKRLGALARSAASRVLDELQASPVTFTVILAATAISYDSLRHMALGVGLPEWAAFLFPLTLDVAAYPALRIALSSAYNWAQRVFGSLIGLGALVGSIYGNLADHLGWAVFPHPSVQSVYFVSVVPPATIGCTLLLSLFRPKDGRESVFDRIVDTVVPPAPARPSTPVDKAVDSPEQRAADLVEAVAEGKATIEPVQPPRRPSLRSVGNGPTLRDRQKEWVRKYWDENGREPTGSEVNTAFKGETRNGHKAIADVRKEREQADVQDRAL